MYTETINFLKKQDAVPPLEQRNGMKAGARIHAEDLGEVRFLCSFLLTPMGVTDFFIPS